MKKKDPFTKLVNKLSAQLLDQMDGDDGMVAAEISQDAQGEAVDAAEDILILAGYTRDTEEFSELLDAIVAEIQFVPAHWEFARRKK